MDDHTLEYTTSLMVDQGKANFEARSRPRRSLTPGTTTTLPDTLALPLRVYHSYLPLPLQVRAENAFYAEWFWCVGLYPVANPSRNLSPKSSPSVPI